MSNYKKGSRPNPYTMAEFNSLEFSSEWYGGWVKNGDDLIYHSINHSTYIGQCTQGSPVPEDYFSEMQSNEIWTGGWVSTAQNGTKFYDADGTEYENTLGSMSNPYPLLVFNDLIMGLNWSGGWIREYDNSLRYVQPIEINLNSGGGGSGCGCGSGSGCGGDGYDGCSSGSGGLEPSTCPILEGHIKGGVLSIPDENVVGDLYLSWSGGNTRICELSNITITIIPRESKYTFENSSLYVAWEDAYEAVMHGTFRVIKFHSVDLGTYSFDGHFVVPTQYRINIK